MRLLPGMVRSMNNQCWDTNPGYEIAGLERDAVVSDSEIDFAFQFLYVTEKEHETVAVPDCRPPKLREILFLFFPCAQFWLKPDESCVLRGSGRWNYFSHGFTQPLLTQHLQSMVFPSACSMHSPLSTWLKTSDYRPTEKDLIEKLTVAQMSKDSTPFIKTQRFITVFTRQQKFRRMSPSLTDLYEDTNVSDKHNATIFRADIRIQVRTGLQTKIPSL